MKYIRKFTTEDEFNDFELSLSTPRPSVCLIGDNDVRYNPQRAMKDIPFYIEALEDLTFSCSKSVFYSLDRNLWQTLHDNKNSETILSGSKVYIKATGIDSISISGNCNVGGNIMSLTDSDNFRDAQILKYETDLSGLFLNNTKLKDAKKLVLPAVEFEGVGYLSIFEGCTSLITAPEVLPAPTIPMGVYNNMFKNCTNLINPPKILASWAALNSCVSMFENCTSLVTAPKLNATEIGDGCYKAMFKGCTSLINAPELLVTQTYASGCYQSMFEGCSSLQYIKALITYPSLGESFSKNWVSGVAATGTFVKNAEATWDVTGVDGIPEGWTVETATE